MLSDVCIKSGCHNNGARGGGVAIWTKNKLRARPISLLTDIHFEVCSVLVPDAKLLISGKYMPPGVAGHLVEIFRKTLCNALNAALEDFPLDRQIVSGD